MSSHSREEYFRERQALIEGERISIGQFDKALLTLSAGALVISIAFVREIAPDPNPVTLWLLSSAWTCFEAALLASLFSFLVSQHAFRKQRDLLDASVEQDKPPGRNWIAPLVGVLNWGGAVFFVGGAIFLSRFALANLKS